MKTGLSLRSHLRLFARRAKFVLLLTLCAPGLRAATVHEAWVQRYDNIVSNAELFLATRVVSDLHGGVIVVGISGQQVLTIKYSAANGSVLWAYRREGSSPNVVVDALGNVVVTYGTDIAKCAAADGTLLWERSASGRIYAVAVDARGNVLATGSTTSKYAAADGVLLWEADGGGSRMAVDSKGNVVVAQDDDDANYLSIAKYAGGDGVLIWGQSYYHSPTPGGEAELAAIAVDQRGNVIVTGSRSTEYYTSKYRASDGRILWERRYHTPNDPITSDEYVTSLALDGWGNVVVTGYPSTLKYEAASGALLWEKRYVGPGRARIFGQALAVDAIGNVVVAGRTNISKYAPNGTLLSKRSYNDLASQSNVTVRTVDASGNVVMAGNSDPQSYAGSYTAMYNANGTMRWKKSYFTPPRSAEDVARAVAVDPKGNVVVTGSSSNGREKDYCTVKYGPDGALLWSRHYNGPGNWHDEPQAVAMDAKGNVLVAGYSASTNGGTDYYTVKYAARSGALVWSKRHQSLGFDRATAMVLDAKGDVVVTGRIFNELNFNDDYYTAKYRAADGALRWKRRSNSPGIHNDSATAVALDDSGNVVVTGYSILNYFRGDFYTAKYAAKDGALLWEKRYHGPHEAFESYDWASAVAVDRSGNVVVTGSSANSSGVSDYYTAKYAAADGTLLWEKRYSGSVSHGAQAQAMVVDGSGNVVVTGYPATVKYAAADGALLWVNGGGQALAIDGSGDVVVTGSNEGYYTAKYAAANGALLWEQRYKGSTNGADAVGGSHALALGPGGLVIITGTSVGDYATVKYVESPTITPSPVSIGYMLQFSSNPGQRYVVQRAPTVTGPWATLTRVTAPADGYIHYTDTNPPLGQSFYRTAAP